MANLILIRGLPGCGKSTLAETLQPNAALRFAADDFFQTPGGWVFDYTRLAEAHEDCLSRVRQALSRAQPSDVLVVHNTFVKAEHLQPYVKLAPMCKGHKWWVVDLFDQGLLDEDLARQTVHQVPIHTIRKMRSMYEPWVLKL